MTRSALVLVFALATLPPAASAQTPRKVSYAEARRSGRPHECSYGLPFMGATVFFRAHVRGDDLQALNVTVPDPQTFELRASPGSFEEHLPNAFMRFWRIGNMNYYWQRAEPPDPPVAIKVEARVVAAMPDPEMLGVAAPAPPADAPCSEVSRALLDLPSGVVFSDHTAQMLEELGEPKGAPQGPPTRRTPLSAP